MKPEELKYTKDHEWIGRAGELWTVGISDYAQSQLGDITYVELPKVGKTFKAGESMCVIESVKVASDIFAPAGGTVAEVNKEVERSPELVNQEPYGGGWICRLKGVDQREADALMTAGQYAAYAGKSGK